MSELSFYYVHEKKGEESQRQLFLPLHDTCSQGLSHETHTCFVMTRGSWLTFPGPCQILGTQEEQPMRSLPALLGLLMPGHSSTHGRVTVIEHTWGGSGQDDTRKPERSDGLGKEGWALGRNGRMRSQDWEGRPSRRGNCRCPGLDTRQACGTKEEAGWLGARRQGREGETRKRQAQAGARAFLAW